MMTAVGSAVVFREDSPQYAKNAGIVYVVVPAPDGSPSSVDNTHPEDLGRVYLWLEAAADSHLAPSYRRRRTGYATSLIPAPTEGS